MMKDSVGYPSVDEEVVEDFAPVVTPVTVAPRVGSSLASGAV